MRLPRRTSTLLVGSNHGKTPAPAAVESAKVNGLERGKFERCGELTRLDARFDMGISDMMVEMTHSNSLEKRYAQEIGPQKGGATVLTHEQESTLICDSMECMDWFVAEVALHR